jgi:hypothetical protein
MSILKWMNPTDWKRAIALIIVWAYGWQLAVWGPLSWIVLLIGHFIGRDLPVPIIVPWEHLITGTVTLGTIGGIETWRERARTNDKESG